MVVRVLGGPLRGSYLAMHALERPSYALGRYETGTITAVAAHGDGSVVYDIGANIGYTALAAAKTCREVHCFEAEPRTLEALAWNVEHADANNLTIVSKAVTDHCEGVAFASFNYSLIGHIERDSEPPDAEIVEVPSISIDAYVESGNSAPDVMKIDVEGNELKVLKGAEETLRAHRPVVICEVWRETLADVTAFMASMSYSWVNLDGGFVLEVDGLTDLIFTHA